MYKLQPAPERRYVFSASTRIAAGTRDLSRRNVSTAQTRPQNSKASFAHQPLRTEVRAPSLLRSPGDYAKHIPSASDESHKLAWIQDAFRVQRAFDRDMESADF